MLTYDIITLLQHDKMCAYYIIEKDQIHDYMKYSIFKQFALLHNKENKKQVCTISICIEKGYFELLKWLLHNNELTKFGQSGITDWIYNPSSEDYATWRHIPIIKIEFYDI